MKYTILILLIIILFSCQNKLERINSIELTVSQIDSLNANGKLIKKFYPNMSACGGALNGFYYKNKLVFMDATFQGEISYTRKKMYLSNSDFINIIYLEHFPEWEKYEKRYPIDEFDFEPSKMTFADTLYEFDLGTKIRFKKTFDNEVLSTKLDSTLLNKLLDCGKRMKEELESITE